MLTVQLLLLVAVTPFTQLLAKVEVIQRRSVAPENLKTFIFRETNYWSEVAMKAIDEGKMTEWSLWQRVGGKGLDDSHNFIVINTFDKRTDLNYIDDIRNFKTVFPEKTLDEIDTAQISILKDVFFYERIAFSFKSLPKIIRINYAKTTYINDFLELEQTLWFPFLQERMDSNKTNVVSWTVSKLLSPQGKNMNHDAIVIDGFDKLSDALFTTYGADVPFPDTDALLSVHYKADEHIYKLIKIVGNEKFEY